MTKRQRYLSVAAALFVLIVLPAISFYYLNEGRKARDERKLPDFTLMDMQGDPFTLSSLEGKVHVASFLFARCDNQVCQDINKTFRQLQEDFKSEDDLWLVTYFIDPEDSTEVLQQYASSLKARDHWQFVGGDQEAVFNLINGGYFGKVKQGTGHYSSLGVDDKVVLVNREGYIRGYFPVEDAEDYAKLKQAIADLLNDEK